MSSFHQNWRMYFLTPSAELLHQVNESSRVLDAIASCTTERGDEFQSLYVNPLLVIADWIQNLPCTQHNHAELTGGLRFACQCGFVALRFCENAIFTPPHMSEHRSVLERQFRRAAYLAAIFSAMAFPMQMTIVVSTHGEVWSGNEPLASWAPAKDGYDFKWSEAVMNFRVGSFRASRAIPMDLLADLHPMITAELLNSISPDQHPVGQESVMQKLVRSAIAKTIDHEKKLQSAVYKPPVNPTIPNVLLEHQGQSEVSPPPVQQSDAPVQSQTHPLIKEAQSGGIKSLEPAYRELLEMLRDEISQGGPASKKVRITDKGALVPANLLSKQGMQLPAVKAELRRKQLIVNEEGNMLLLVAEVGDFLLSGNKGGLYGEQ